MSRQMVVNMVLNACTLDGCLSAEEALTQWLTAHPQDIGLHGLAGQVGIVKAPTMERAAGGDDAGSSGDDFARTNFTRSNL